MMTDYEYVAMLKEEIPSCGKCENLLLFAVFQFSFALQISVDEKPAAFQVSHSPPESGVPLFLRNRTILI